MRITIETVQHQSQRYPTVGDWYNDGYGGLKINVSDMKNWRYEFLVGIHELVEAALCKDRNISQREVDNFDLKYEENRLPDDKDTEPGDSPQAPYYAEHVFAGCIERLLAHELGIEWAVYEHAIAQL